MRGKIISGFKGFGRLLLNAVIIVGILIGAILLIATVGESYFDRPPVQVESLNPEYLGEFCSGELSPIENIVTIEKPVVALYYISVMDSAGIYNIIGTQVIYSGFQHPTDGVFTQTIPWRIPPLPPGKYTRSFAARGTDTSELTVFITKTFTVKEQCGGGD